MATATVPTAATRAAAPYRLTYAILLLGVGAYSLLQSLVEPVLLTIQENLGTTQATVTWVMTAYLLSASVATPILGRIGDMVGKERMLVLTLGALAAGSVVAALATNIGVMIGARVLQGVGGAVLPLTFGIIRDVFPREKVAGAVGIAGSLLAVGGGLGLVLAGPIVNTLSWHWLFWLPAIMVSLAAVASWRFVPRTPRAAAGHVNLAAAFLLAGWLVSLLLAVSQGRAWGWTSPAILGLFAAGAVLLVTWVAVESRSAHPLIDMRMMRRRPVWTANLSALAFGSFMFAFFAFLPQFLQMPASTGYGFGADITRSGLYLLPMTVANFVVGLLTGRIIAALGARTVLIAGSAVTGLAVAFLAVAHSEPWHILLASPVVGLGFGLAFAAMSTVVVEAVPASQTGVASGMNANIRTIGGAVGSAAIGTVVVSSAGASGLPAESGWTTAFLLMSAAALLAAVAGLLIPRRYAAAPTPAPDRTPAAEPVPAATR